MELVVIREHLNQAVLGSSVCPSGVPYLRPLLRHWSSFSAFFVSAFIKGVQRSGALKLILSCRWAVVEDTLRESTRSPGENVFLEPKTRK